MIERAIVLAAGFGKRVLPLTNTTPKPLLKINNVSLLENTLNFLKKFGVKSFAINIHHLGEQIISFAEDNKKKYDIKIFKEKDILGTGGGIRNALDFFEDKPFISINSDTIWSNEYLSPLNNLYKNARENEIEILINDKGVPDIKWESDEFLFNRLPMVEIPIPEFHHPIAFTYRMSFGVELPKGYSLLVTQPFNRHDLPFTIPSAIVDADTKFFPIDIRLFLKRGFEGKIKKGTPIYQMIPFKRESWEMETDYNEKNIKERFWFHEKRRKYLFAWYHHHAHVKKEFS